jgi:O-antigen/teichoic acid export membrane protein
MVAAIFISPLVSLLQLAEYAKSTAVFFLMSPAILLRILADVPSYVLYAAHADHKLLLCNLGSAVVSVLLNAALIPLLGIYGAAVSGCIASGVLLSTLTFFAAQIMREPSKDPEAREPVSLPKESEMLYP